MYAAAAATPTAVAVARACKSRRSPSSLASTTKMPVAANHLKQPTGPPQWRARLGALRAPTPARPTAVAESLKLTTGSQLDSRPMRRHRLQAPPTEYHHPHGGRLVGPRPVELLAAKSGTPSTRKAACRPASRSPLCCEIVVDMTDLIARKRTCMRLYRAQVQGFSEATATFTLKRRILSASTRGSELFVATRSPPRVLPSRHSIQPFAFIMAMTDKPGLTQNERGAEMIWGRARGNHR